MAIPRVQPSSKVKNALVTKKKKLKNKSKKVVSFNLDKSIVSYKPKAKTKGSHEFDPKNSSTMERALDIQANLGSEFPSFVKLMLPSHVAGGFWLGLPKKFTSKHLPNHDEIVILVDESELEHGTKYLAEKNGLSAGWKGFSIAHKLKENDVLVFHRIEKCKFKVYILRANALTKIDGADASTEIDGDDASTEIDGDDASTEIDGVIIPLLNLGCVKEMDSEKNCQQKDRQITVMAREDHLEQNSPVHSVQERDMVALSNNLDAAADHSGIDIDIHIDNNGSDFNEGLRFSQSVVEFKDVKNFENFNIVVDGLIIDCEIPKPIRVKYYELCCSQKSYIHDQLIEGLNLQLVVGAISETINIANAIRSLKRTTCCKSLKIWDSTLKAFEDLGMKVGFLRGRIKKLLALSSDSQDALKRKVLEKVKAEEELKALRTKLIRVKEVIRNSDYAIEAMKMKTERLEAEFMEEVKAPW